jgi:3-oxoadipate enol-lactonase
MSTTSTTTTTTITGLVPVSTDPDIRIFYRVDGPLDNSKPIILLSNSLAANTQLWDKFVTAFSSDYTLICYDSRFHGQSPLSITSDFDYHAGHTIEDLASDIVKLLDYLKVKRLKALVGLSIGAAVGLVFGAQHPDRVEHVLVVGTKAASNPEANANHDVRIAYGRENGSRLLGQQSVGRWFKEDWIADNPETVACVTDIVGGQSIEGFEASVAALKRLDLWPYVEDIGKRGDGGRFHFVAGEWDSTIPQESRQLAAKSGSKVVIIPYAGHIVNIQQPETFHQAVRSIIEK